MAIQKLGHVGIWARDLPRMRDFYSNVVGLTIADETPTAVFMSSDPDREHHEFVLFQTNETNTHTSVQQISFSCESIQDVIAYYNRFKENNVRFERVVSHGNAVGLYFRDPEDNRCEVYWTTPWKAHQPYGVAVDLTRPVDELLRSIEEDVKIYGGTGHSDPDSFKTQREQFEREGIRV
ncbi:MAG: VOC family protein [Chloroflexi bacterium]|nr:VOC family protein [Chloroflexota bacterium]